MADSLKEFYGDTSYTEITEAKTIYCGGKQPLNKFTPEYLIKDKKASKFNPNIWGDIDVFISHWNDVRVLRKMIKTEYHNDITDMQWCSLAGLHNVMMQYGEKPILDMIQLNGGNVDEDQVGIFDLLE